MKGHTSNRRSLCDGCQAGIVAQAPGGRRMVYCKQMSRTVFPDVAVCNAYEPFGNTGYARYGWHGQAHVSEANIIDPRPATGQHL